LETTEILARNEEQEDFDRRQSAAFAQSYGEPGPIQINIADDVDGEAVYGQNRDRHRSCGR